MLKPAKRIPPMVASQVRAWSGDAFDPGVAGRLRGRLKELRDDLAAAEQETTRWKAQAANLALRLGELVRPVAEESSRVTIAPAEGTLYSVETDEGAIGYCEGAPEDVLTWEEALSLRGGGAAVKS